jgi:hypothetical protein
MYLWMKVLLAVNRMASGQLLTVHRCWNSPPLTVIAWQACCTKNSWSKRHQACCILSFHPLQWHSLAYPMCYIIGMNDDLQMTPQEVTKSEIEWLWGHTTSRTWQEWDQVITEARQLTCFVLPIDLSSDCLNNAWHHEKNGQESHHTVPILSAALPVVCYPVVTVILQIESVNGRPLIVEVRAHKDQGDP